MGLAAVVLAAILAGCSATPRVIPIAVSPGQPRPPAERIADYPAAFQAIAAVMSEELKLPIPRAALYLYPNRDAFEQGLITERHFEPALARETASFARGLGGPDSILVNEGALARTPWSERIRFLAHEFTHVIQYDLAAGRRGTGDQWFREGFAEWVAFRVVDSLGLESYASLRSRRIREATNVRGRKAFPVLSEMVTFAQWVALRSRQGAEVTYGQGFLAVDLLIERKGLRPAVEYFRRFTRSDDRLANFRASFGQPLPEFEREFAAHLQRLLQ